MASKVITKGLKRTALSVALGMCFAGSALAQSNSTGNISGQTTAGGTVVIENAATGFRREVTADANGNYRVSSLQPGTYKVTAGGATKEITVSIGGTATLDTVKVVGTGAINPIDVASVESTTVLTAEQIEKIPVPRNITSVALLAPGTVRGDAAFGNLASFGGSSVAENQYYVNGFNISNAFKGLDFGQIPFEAIAEQQVKTGGYGAEFGRSTGGVINLVTKRGTNEFHAGGNIFWTPESLRGHDPNVYTNAGFVGVNKSVRDRFLYEDNSKDEAGEAWVATVWASGALIKDHLFAYALLSYGRTTGIETYGAAYSFNRRTQLNSNSSGENKNPNWLLKMDWAINDSHSLELTAFSDKRKSTTDFYKNPLAGNPNCTPANIANPANSCHDQPYPDAEKVLERGDYLGTFYQELGGTSYSLKYTGYLTDSFTLSALYGHGESKRSQSGIYANGLKAEYSGNLDEPAIGCPAVINGANNAQLGCNFFGAIGSPNNKDQRDQFRIDAEWSLGDHLIRFGYDSDKFKSRDGTDTEGGATYTLLGLESNNIFDPATNPVTGYVHKGTYDNHNGVDELVADKSLFRNGAEVEVDSTAFYVEDTWNVTDNFLLYAGLRWDNFKNKNGEGKAYIDVKNQFAPRLGFSWDVNGDSSFKVFGNAGRYFLPLSATVAIRGASASLFADDFITYDGRDPVTNEPLNQHLIFRVPVNGENGEPKDPNSITTSGIKPQYQDEFIAGFQVKLTDHITGGVRGIYRNLKSAIDDFCDYRYFAQVTHDRGLTFDPSNLNYCHLYNPGKDSVFLADTTGSGTFEEIAVPSNYYALLRVDPTRDLNNEWHVQDPTVDADGDGLPDDDENNDGISDQYNPLRFTADEVALIDKGAKAKRTYKALEFFAEGHWDKLFLQGSYTWAKSSGNFEGGVKSDIGQADTGTTQDFDYPELEIGTTGYLPNDRRHSFKLFGNYEFTNEWSGGFNLLVQSGRPQNCLGIYGGDPIFYRNSYFSCDATIDSACFADGVHYDPTTPQGAVNFRQCPPAGGRTNNGYSRGNRGDRGRTPWMRQLDLNVAYRPDFADGNLTFKMDIFNVFNEHTATSVWERGENRAGLADQDVYLIPTSFQAPRSFRFMVEYDY